MHTFKTGLIYGNFQVITKNYEEMIKKAKKLVKYLVIIITDYDEFCTEDNPLSGYTRKMILADYLEERNFNMKHIYLTGVTKQKNYGSFKENMFATMELAIQEMTNNKYSRLNLLIHDNNHACSEELFGAILKDDETYFINDLTFVRDVKNSESEQKLFLDESECMKLLIAGDLYTYNQYAAKLSPSEFFFRRQYIRYIDEFCKNKGDEHVNRIQEDSSTSD